MERANFTSKHEPYRRQKNPAGGPQYLFKFSNGYGASLIHLPVTGMEIGLIYWKNASQYVFVDTAPVRQNLTFRGIEDALDEIAGLPPRALF